MRRRTTFRLAVGIICFCTTVASAQYLGCAGYEDDFDCGEPPRETAPCPTTTVSREWMVSNAMEATALATALICSGGVFNVEWRGMVTLEQELNVLDGAVLNVTGVDPEAGVEGRGATRAFTVLNATLHLSNMLINNGSATAGAAIVASGSSLVLDHTSFTNNAATKGGALYVGSESVVTLSGKTRFSENSADEGGALHVSGGSSVSWTSYAYFDSNRANSRGDGGALFVGDGSTVSWSTQTDFSRNNAHRGGALFVIDGSSAFWTAETYFSRNTAVEGAAVYVENISSVGWTAGTSFVGDREAWDAERADRRSRRIRGWGGGLDGNGGALQVNKGSTATWSAETKFSSNLALWGGAISVENESKASWNATTIFSHNLGSLGGALHVRARSSVFWAAETYFTNNQAWKAGGGVSVLDESSVSWAADTYFSGNRAAYFGSEGRGGAMLVYSGSTASWTAETSLTNNSANEGGALYVGKKSTVVWEEKTLFSNNVASYRTGGALVVFDASTVSWTAPTCFSNNTGRFGGGGLEVLGSSDVSWSGETVFSNNSANRGGAIDVAYMSNVSWTAGTSFLGNSAFSGSGGALNVGRLGRVFWGAETSFNDNRASGSGGAVFMGHNSTLRWSGPTEFLSNRALLHGGAVGSSPAGSDGPSSLLKVNGAADFSGNTCGHNGGAVALMGALSLAFETEDVLFEGNSAGTAGGAVYISGTGLRPRFFRVRFTSNTAQVGGAVYVAENGTAATRNSSFWSDIVLHHPTMFIDCDFIANEAAATGGAVETGSGLDELTSATFAQNAAGAGGALRLVGSSSLENCSFDSNVSGEGGGSAISNIGFIKHFQNCRFVNSTFDCAPGAFLDSNATGDSLLTACSGCSTPCDRCSPQEPAPLPTCSSELEHTHSAGGKTTLELLEIVPGYWRETATSRDVVSCFNMNACLGGITGTGGYCQKGYEGPYCSICSDGYTATFGRTCSECTSQGSGLFAVAAVVAVLVALLLVAFFSHLVSGDPQSSGRSIISRMTRRVPVQSLKIVIIVWQILTQFASTANVSYPGVYQQFLDAVDVFNLDLRWMTSVGCIVDMDFHSHLFVTTIGPIVSFAFLGVTYALAVGRNHRSDFAIENVQRKHESAVLLVTFLVYSPVSATLFQMFACEELEDGRKYLRADYRIECDNRRHHALQVYAGFMIIVYTVGIPLLYAALLFRSRDVLTGSARHQEELISVTTTSDLRKAYKPNRFYYEVVECGRRVLLAGAVVFIYPDTATQVAVTLLIAVFILVVSEGLAPYVSRWDAWVSRMGHVIVFTSMYVALLLKADLSDEQRGSQKVFDVILMSAHAVMIIVVVVKAITMAFTLSHSHSP